MRKISPETLEGKLFKALDEKFSFPGHHFGRISFITENVAVIVEHNQGVAKFAEEFLGKYGYVLEGGNFIDGTVVFLKKPFNYD